MENSNVNQEYLDALALKFSFIKLILITDFEGALILSSANGSEFESKVQNNEIEVQDDEKFAKVKITVPNLFNTAIDQCHKIEKMKTKSLTLVYNNNVLFQAKINKVNFVHVIVDAKTYNYEILKEISQEIDEMGKAYEKDFEKIINGES